MTKIVVDLDKMRKNSAISRRAAAAKRREKVKELKARGLKSKEIAIICGVNIYTIYRDLATLKSEAEAQEKD